MGVRLGIAVAAKIPVHIDVGDHAAGDELLGHEVASEGDALLLHLARDRELHLARELCVLTLLGRLDFVPEGLPVAQMLRRALRQHHLRVDDAGLVREVVMAVEPLVMEPRRRAVGG